MLKPLSAWVPMPVAVRTSWKGFLKILISGFDLKDSDLIGLVGPWYLRGF